MFQHTCYTLIPPAYRLNGAEHVLPSVASSRYEDNRFAVDEVVTPLKDGLMSVRRAWTNVSGDAVAFQPMLEVLGSFSAHHHVIPCISYNGNPWGQGGEPKGLTRDGVPYVFAYHRTGIPSCTLSENDDVALAVFASDTDAQSLTSSCSLVKNADGSCLHRILYPIIEEPATYSARDRFSGDYQTYIELAPRQTFAATAFIWCGVPRWPNYGMADVLDIALEALQPAAFAPAITARKVWELGIAYAKRLAQPVRGRRLLCIGLTPEGDSRFQERAHYEIGWCGQNALYARMLMLHHRQHGDPEALSLALDILDAWAEDAPRASGLMYVHYENQWQEGADQADICNLSIAAAELIRAYRLAADMGIDKPAYLRAAAGICEFFIAHYSTEHGFGKSWHIESGQPVDTGGTIGAFMVPALSEYYRQTGNEAALDTAKQALRFYASRDLDKFMCTAGALDTACVDKETSGALIMGGIMLYEDTNEEEFLTIARKAAYYFSSWAFHYDALYGADSDFVKYGFRTLGGTSVSAQHHHLDPWGGLMVCWYLKLAEHTGDMRWRQRAQAMWRHVTQCITPEGGKIIRGRLRPEGSQNEAYFHCRWGHSQVESQPGMMNDWLVAWPGAFRLFTLASVQDWTVLDSASTGMPL
ncbi:MAG: hypothetical protein GX916_02900 [Clostridiales bacterium]|nr:hypothetical protein [Clostridiales bacterium]